MTIPRSVLSDFWYVIAYSAPYTMDLERCAITKVPFFAPKRLAAQSATFSAVGYLAHPARAKTARSGKAGLTTPSLGKDFKVAAACATVTADRPILLAP